MRRPATLPWLLPPPVPHDSGVGPLTARRRSPHSPPPAITPPTPQLPRPPSSRPPPPSRQHTDICIFMRGEPQCEGRSVSAFCFPPAADAPERLRSANQRAPLGVRRGGGVFFIIHTRSSRKRGLYFILDLKLDLHPSSEEPLEHTKLGFGRGRGPTLSTNQIPPLPVSCFLLRGRS